MAGSFAGVITSGAPYNVTGQLREELTAKLAILRGFVDFFRKKAMIVAIQHQNAPRSREDVDRSSDTGARGTGPTKIFISHASDDVELAKKLIAVIEATVHAPTKSILCTSVSGYRLEPGDDVPDVLRAKLKESTVVIGLLTPAGFASSYVLMELGAAWGFGRRAVPLLGPHVTFGKLPGFFKDIHSLRLDHQEMMELCEALPKHTSLTGTNNLSRINAAVNDLTKLAAMQSDGDAGAPGGAPASTFRT
jgi:hypothetical protein